MAFERTPRLKSSLRHPSTRPIIIERKAPDFFEVGLGHILRISGPDRGPIFLSTSGASVARRALLERNCQICERGTLVSIGPKRVEVALSSKLTDLAAATQ